MDGLRWLVREIHSRSLWQVLAVYLAGSWVALQVVDALTRTAGLPDWVRANRTFLEAWARSGRDEPGAIVAALEDR